MRRFWVILLVSGYIAGSGCNGTGAHPSAAGAGGASGTPAGAAASGGMTASQSGSGGAVSGGSGSGGTMMSGGAGGTHGQATGGAGAMAFDAGTGGASAAAGASADAAPTPSADCDRACLVAIASDYLDALAARDSSKLALSASLKYTENGMTQQLGQGLWQTASGLDATTRLTFADPMTGQVGTQIVIDENSGSPVIYQVRLKVVDHAISEIESMAVRQADAANGFFNVAGMQPEAIFTSPVDAGKRMTRDELKTEVDHYIDYLDGKTGADGVHFDTNCSRYENGVATASGLSSFQLQSWSFDVVPRYLVFDEEYGIAWGMFPFTQDATALVVGEAFKVVDKNIMMIRAVMANMPAKAWD